MKGTEEAPKMRVLLQNTLTSLYFCTVQGDWTPRFGQALNFERIQSALEVVERYGLSEVQVILVIEREKGVEFVPLQIQPLLQPDRSLAMTTAPHCSPESQVQQRRMK